MVGNRKVRDPVWVRRALPVGTLAFLTGLLVFGCGGQSVGDGSDEQQEQQAASKSCVKLCEDAKDARCPGSEKLDCEGSCLWDDFAVQGTGCYDEYQAMIACSGKLDDICTVREKCKSEKDELTACFKDSCSRKPAEYCP